MPAAALGTGHGEVNPGGFDALFGGSVMRKAECMKKNASLQTGSSHRRIKWMRDSEHRVVLLE